MDSDTEFVPVTISDDQTILLEVLIPDGREKASSLAKLNFPEFTRQLRAIVKSIGTEVDTWGASKVSIELGVSASLKNGQLIAVLCTGEAGASIKVTAEFTRRQPARDS